MSILLKGMEMPDSCRHCCMMTGTFCDVLNIDVDPYYDGAKHRNVCCPLVELPEKHGRLIDGDVLWDTMSKYNDNEGAKMPFGYDNTSIHIDSACFVIENAPTVIGAEGEE